jgi:RNA polymerase sigma factor (sigma-70 family)
MEGQPIVSPLPISARELPVERLEYLFDRHRDRLYRFARRLAPSMDDALDLVQDTFLRAARSLNSIPTESLSEQEAWLIRILINVRNDQWRKTQVRARHASASTDVEAMNNSPSPENAVIARTTIWSALDQLHPRRRAVLVMHELDDIPVPEIAGTLGISAITVRWHLAVGRRELARTLKPFTGENHEKH